MNRVDLVGRLTRDPELRHTNSGMAVCQITLAINRNFSNQNGEREADFINVVVWGKQAENVSRYVTKGRLVGVDGRLQTRNYEDKDGKKVYVTEVVAANVEFLSSGNSNNNSNVNYASTGPSPFDTDVNVDNSPSESMSTEVDVFKDFGDSIEITDNDLPF